MVNPPLPQRLTRRLPGSGRQSLYLASHAGNIVGWPMPEGRSLLFWLIDHATQPQIATAMSGARTISSGGTTAARCTGRVRTGKISTTSATCAVSRSGTSHRRSNNRAHLRFDPRRSRHPALTAPPNSAKVRRSSKWHSGPRESS